MDKRCVSINILLFVKVCIYGGEKRVGGRLDGTLYVAG